jgi:hypothetical protein
VTKLLEPPEGRQVFRLTFEPAPADIDENGHVNNVVYLRWAQDMGVAHWRSLAPPEKNGVLISMSALSAIEALGPKAASLHELVRTMKPDGPSPDERFDSYVPRLIANIVPSANAGKASPAAKGKRKKKAGEE